MFHPKIIGFVCNWSLPSEVDAVNTCRLHGYPKIHIIRVMCIGRVDPVSVLETFANGADGVLIVGCQSPDCHYRDGNRQAEWKIGLLHRLLFRTGLEPARLRLMYTRLPEIARFRKITDDFRNHVIALGPSPLLRTRKLDEHLLSRINAAKLVAGNARLRTLVGREQNLLEAKNVYDEWVSQENFDDVLEECVDSEYIRSRIRLLVQKNAMSVERIANCLNLDAKTVLRHVVVLRQRGLLALDHIKGADPVYVALEVP